MRHLITKAIICMMLIGLMSAAGMLVYADDNIQLIDHMKAATLVSTTPAPISTMPIHEKFKDVLDKLVQEGKLSKEKAEQINKYIEMKKEEQKNLNDAEKKRLRHGFKHGLINELLEAKIISEGEAEAIRSKFAEIREQAFKGKLDTLVARGTITQAQADQVLKYFIDARKERIEQFKKLQGMNEEQKKEFFKEHRKSSFIQKLVEDKVITEEQAKELKKLMKEGRRHKPCENLN